MNRRTFMQLTASTLAATAAETPFLEGQAAPAEPFFPYGTHIYREPHLPLEQLRHDMPMLKNLGFNMIKIQESWSTDEKKEGEIDLSTVCQVLSDARSNGLKVYFGVTMEEPPAWFWQKYTDAYLTYNTGERHFDQLQYVLPADGKPGPCWHHPEGRAAAIRFMEAVGRQVGRYDNIYVWNVWQEIGFWPMRPGFMGFCYCPYSLREFRSWLKGRYGTIDKVNAMWKCSYGSFDEVIPPRLAGDLPPQIEFRYFMDDVYLPGVLKWKADALRRTDPHHRKVFAHASDPLLGSSQQWRWAESLDFFGSSSYPAWYPFADWDRGQASPGGEVEPNVGKRAELWNSVMIRYDYLRCASPDGNVWAAEFQGGPVVRGLQRGRVPSAEDIERWMMGALAAGIRGLCFWNHRAEIFWREEFGFGLLELEGDALTPRAQQASLMGKALNQHAELFHEGVVPQAKVAMLVSEDLYHFHKGTIHANGFGSPGDHLEHTIRGIYRGFWEKGIALDFLDASQFAARASGYQALILVFPAALSASLVDQLAAYVENGGVLISELCPGRLSEHGIGNPGGMPPALRTLFGATHREMVMIREPNNGSVWTGSEATYGDTIPYRQLSGAGPFREQSIMPAFLLQTIAATSATPILMDGEETVGCVNRVGKGSAYLFGTLLGHAILSYGDTRNSEYLAAVLAAHGIMPDRVGQLVRRRRIGKTETAWFFINPSDSAVEESVPVEGFSSVSDLLSGSLPIAAGKVTIKVPAVSVRCLVLQA
jgi:beta-galactosidase